MIIWNFISGVSVGIEFFSDTEEGSGMILDLLILRIIFFKD
jgi:hypothetical protein